MVQKYKLNLAVGFTILIITIWLILAKKVWDWTGNLLLLGAIALIIKTLLTKEKKPAKLLEFCIKSLVVSYAVTSIFWFALLRITSPWYYAYLDLELLMNILLFNILPLALLPTSVSVIIYGVFRIKLKAWEFFLSSWYASIFVVFTVYQIWWTLYVQPYLPEFYYSSIAGAIVLAFGFVLLAFIIAGILTIVYVKLKKRKIETPP